jgi:hypothetical protein
VAKPTVVRCPICKKEVIWEKSPYRPFCSERCKLIDLGEWLSEDYRISSPLEEDEDGSPPPHPDSGPSER